MISNARIHSTWVPFQRIFVFWSVRPMQSRSDLGQLTGLKCTPLHYSDKNVFWSVRPMQSRSDLGQLSGLKCTPLHLIPQNLIYKKISGCKAKKNLCFLLMMGFAPLGFCLAPIISFLFIFSITLEGKWYAFRIVWKFTIISIIISGQNTMVIWRVCLSTNKEGYFTFELLFEKGNLLLFLFCPLSSPHLLGLYTLVKVTSELYLFICSIAFLEGILQLSQ